MMDFPDDKKIKKMAFELCLKDGHINPLIQHGPNKKMKLWHVYANRMRSAIIIMNDHGFIKLNVPLKGGSE